MIQRYRPSSEHTRKPEKKERVPREKKVEASAQPKRKRGRPVGSGLGKPSPLNKYDPKFAAQAKKACEHFGATDEDLGILFNVSLSTIKNWKVRHAEFRAALIVGKEPANKNIERSLYHVAKGYTYEEEIVKFGKDGKVYRATVLRQQPPNPTAMFFWLQNRMPELWRNVQRHEHTGKDGAPMSIMQLDADKLKGVSTEDLQVLKRVFTSLSTGEALKEERQAPVDVSGYASTLGESTKH